MMCKTLQLRDTIWIQVEVISESLTHYHMDIKFYAYLFFCFVAFQNALRKVDLVASSTKTKHKSWLKTKF